MKGERYVLELVAEQQTNVTAFASGQLRLTSFPNGFGALFSGLYLYSSDCGHHVVDPGEECDDGSDSATCDADCTMVSCGDGYVNAAAGEACDDVFESETCNQTCTAPVCGTMYNALAGEQCDDANKVSGDGCSSTCREIEAGYSCDNTVSPWESTD